MYSMEEHIQRAELCKREISKYRPFEGEMLDEIQSFYRITIEDILTLHRLFYQKIDVQNAGQYRSMPVRISGSQIILPPASKIPAEMDKLGKWMRENEHTMHPVAYAAELHRRFVEIHPYKDADVIIRTKLEKPSKIKGLHCFSPCFYACR